MNQRQQELLRQLAAVCRTAMHAGNAEPDSLKPGQATEFANLLDELQQDLFAAHQELRRCLADLVEDYELIAYSSYHAPRETPGAWLARWSVDSPEWFDIASRGRRALAAEGIELPYPHETREQRTPRGASPPVRNVRRFAGCRWCGLPHGHIPGCPRAVDR